MDQPNKLRQMSVADIEKEHEKAVAQLEEYQMYVSIQEAFVQGLESALLSHKTGIWPGAVVHWVESLCGYPTPDRLITVNKLHPDGQLLGKYQGPGGNCSAHYSKFVLVTPAPENA